MTRTRKTGFALMALAAWVAGCATTNSLAPPPKETPVTAVKTTETKETKTATRNKAVLKYIGQKGQTAGFLGDALVDSVPDGGCCIRKKPQPLTTKSRPKLTKTGPTKGKLVPRIRIGTPIVKGLCKASDVVKVLRRRSSALRTCYERMLKRRPKLHGTVTIGFTIEPSRRVTNTRIIRDTTRNPYFTPCLTGKVRTWRFAKPEKYTCTVKVPMVFSSNY